MIQMHTSIDIDKCPVLHPTVKEFEDFRSYVENLDATLKHTYGMVKVVPPKGWIPHQNDYGRNLNQLTIKSPIYQNISGKGGIYECLHIPKKSISFKEFKSKAVELDKITDGKTQAEVEDMFWKNIAFSAPLYGADLLNTLMDENSKSWNLNNLDSLLSDALPSKVKGINTPYCYVGSWKAFFCWHTEDLDLSGINFLHEGKSKFWYAINCNDRKILEKYVERLFPYHHSACKQFLRHKTVLVNPYHLKRKFPELRICKMEQKYNEFMFVFGGSYHCGFNFGFNVAEAINYATLDWLRQMPEAKHCTCLKSSVKACDYEIYKNLATCTNVSNKKQFLDFQYLIFQKAEAEDSEYYENENHQDIGKYSMRKIKKAEKPSPKKKSNADYTIINWAQCDKCKQWRQIKRAITKSEDFNCAKVNKSCFKREKPKRKFKLRKNR